MYPVSEKFKAALRDSHTVYARAEVHTPHGDSFSLPILSGNISEDKSATVRRRASLSVSTRRLALPGKDYDDSPLWPTGNEIHVYSGIVFKDRSQEEVPMGVYRLLKPVFSYAGDGLTVTLDGYDRSHVINRSRFTDYYEIAKGKRYGRAMVDLIKSRLQTLTDDDFIGFDLIDNFFTPQLIFSPQDGPWEKALDMAKAIGHELFFDGLGRCVIRPEPDPLYTEAAFEYVSGEAQILDGISRELDAEQAYNGVIAVGQSNDNISRIPRGEAWDTDPNSPTYYDPNNPGDSAFGANPYFFTSDYILDDDQALQAARGLLIGVIGVIETVSISGICNPAHEGGDVIRIKDPTTNVDANYLLDSFQIGLGSSGTMSGTTRKRRVTL